MNLSFLYWFIRIKNSNGSSSQIQKGRQFHFLHSQTGRQTDRLSFPFMTFRGLFFPMEYNRSNTFLDNCSFLKEIKKTYDFLWIWLLLCSLKPLYFLIFLPLTFLIFLSSCHPSVKCHWPTALVAVLLAVYFVPIQLNVWFVNNWFSCSYINKNYIQDTTTNTCGKLQLIGYAVRSLYKCRENKCSIKNEKSVCLHHFQFKLQR